MVTYPDKLLRPAAESLLACLCLAVLASPVPTGSCGFRPYINGTPLFGTLDDECCSGTSFVYAGQAGPVTAGTTADPGPVNCKLTWGATMQIGIWRCAPVGDLQLPPAPADWTATQNQLFDDFATLRQAVCCFINARPAKTVSVGEYTIINNGPEGMCIGSSVTLTVGLGKAIA